jgi:TetR/AcrR family transcriptional repressor of nem operon
MGRPSLRDQFIESGISTLHHGGFFATGVREISAQAGAPQGSFINHFGSKGAYGVAVLDRYFERTEAIIAETLGDETRCGADRLAAYFDVVVGALEGAGWRYGCMISNMSLEASEHSEAMRARLEEIFVKLTQHFSAAILAGQATGDVRSDLDADDLADVVLSSWHGAMLRMKVERSPRAIQRFKRLMLSTFLTEPAERVPLSTTEILSA